MCVGEGVCVEREKGEREKKEVCLTTIIYDNEQQEVTYLNFSHVTPL